MRERSDLMFEKLSSLALAVVYVATEELTSFGSTLAKRVCLIRERSDLMLEILSSLA